MITTLTHTCAALLFYNQPFSDFFLKRITAKFRADTHPGEVMHCHAAVRDTLEGWWCIKKGVRGGISKIGHFLTPAFCPLCLALQAQHTELFLCTWPTINTSSQYQPHLTRLVSTELLLLVWLQPTF